MSSWLQGKTSWFSLRNVVSAWRIGELARVPILVVRLGLELSKSISSNPSTGSTTIRCSSMLMVCKWSSTTPTMMLDPCYIWNETRQLDVLNHPKVGFMCLPRRARCYGAPYNHPYVSYKWLRVLAIPLPACSCGGSILFLLTNHCCFPCLIRASIYCFKL